MATTAAISDLTLNAPGSYSPSDALLVTAQSRFRQGDFAGTIDSLERANRHRPISADARILLASSYAKQRQSDTAREMLLQIAIRRDRPADTMRLIASELAAIGDVTLAAQVCRWTLDRDASDPATELAAVTFDLGIYLDRLGEPPYRVEALLAKATLASPDEAHYRIALASMLLRMQRDTEAEPIIQSLDAADVRQLDCPRCLTHIGQNAVRLGMPLVAHRCFDRIDQLDVLRQQDTSFNAPLCFAWEIRE